MARDGDRRYTSPKDVAVLVTLGLQLAALVWGAATLKASVDDLRATVVEVRATLHTINDTQADNTARIRVLEDREHRPER